jgi:ubiquinone/menaquinone biosynthesis C-methylase UbiE
MNKNYIQMYFNETIVRNFAEHEQNEKNFRVAEIVDCIIMDTVCMLSGKDFHAAELWWWAHPDRYHQFFDWLITKQWTIDRVDISPYMLRLANDYLHTPELQKRLPYITFIEKDFFEYLDALPDQSLDVVIMKYTIDHVQDVDLLMQALSMKVKHQWLFVATVGVLDPKMVSMSTNARFLHNWQEFPEFETRTLEDWDTFTVKFFSVSWKPEFWYIPWAETTKYYHSPETYHASAKKYWFISFLWNRKEHIKRIDTTKMLDQNVFIAKKR